MVNYALEFSRVYDRLDAPVNRGDFILARCPAHEDHVRSLSLFVHRDGNALVAKCHAGCGFDEIRDALGLQTKDFFMDDHSQQVTQSKIVATYNYCDEGGVVLYQVCRKERTVDGVLQKTFSHRRPDGEGWQYKMDGVRRVLYRLPEVIAHKGPVVVVEGEKAVDRLNSIKFPAFFTCSSGGAKGWRPEHAKSLAGRDVVIIPDFDSPGIEYAIAVAGSCVLHNAKSIRIVKLPGQNPHDGADDWIGRGRKAKDLIEEIGKSREWRLSE